MLFVAVTAFTGKQTQIEPIMDDATAKVESTTFLTSAICGSCKDKIESELNYTKGIVFAELDMETKEVTVKYKTKHISEEGVKKVVTGLGYDAGDMKRNEEAFNKLPKCCQSAGHCSRD